jgi:hypothetical protein
MCDQNRRPISEAPRNNVKQLGNWFQPATERFQSPQDAFANLRYLPAPRCLIWVMYSKNRASNPMMQQQTPNEFLKCKQTITAIYITHATPITSASSNRICCLTYRKRKINNAGWPDLRPIQSLQLPCILKASCLKQDFPASQVLQLARLF